MSQECFIGIDQGSSATKAVVLGADGGVLFRTRKELRPAFQDNNRVEHDPDEVLASVRDVLDKTFQHCHRSGIPILGIGLSCQRSSCIAWNESSGKPLSRVISWRDTRCSDLVQELAGQGPRIFSLTGLPLTPYYSASKIRWLRDHCAEAKQSYTVFGTLSSYLVQQLTGASRALIDHTNAARTQLMNIHSLSWDRELLDLFGLSGIQLPEIRPTAFQYGGVRTASGSAPLLTAIGDQQAALLGLGVIEKGDCGINYGTGGFLMVNTGSSLVPAPGLMSSVLLSTDNDRQYLIEGSVNAVGSALEWGRTSLGLFKEYQEVDDLCWKALTNVVVFIGLNGTGAPHWEAEISSSMHGLTAESTSADMVRALVENIAFFMNDIAGTIRTAGIETGSIALSGGLSTLSYLVQVQADILKKEVSISSEQEASAVGAALLAGMQNGAWTSGDIKRMTQSAETVAGELNPGLEKRYNRWQELHRMTKILDRM